MPDEDRIVFQVEVEAGPEPISGLIRAGTEEVEFVGWVGLAGAMERVLETATGDDDKSLGVSPT